MGSRVKGVGRSPAGVLACVWIGGQIAPEMSGGVGGGTGGVVVEGLPFLDSEVVVDRWRGASGGRGPALLEARQ
ncbi:hypothetical protein [Actinomadura sp. NPDC049753]|uniref:hypothetical protein n=1 Tax=Actinomadura sp. NPDC049753 TaxID=3154739 RepID=UPI00342A962D